MIRHLLSAALLAALVGTLPLASPALSQDYFVPNQPRPQAPPAPRPQPQRVPVQVPVQVPPGADEQQQPPPPLQVQLPPPPDIPALPPSTKQLPPPVIGVLGVPEIMRVSTAAQQVEKTIGARREKLNEDAQKEQSAWRELQQALANDRGKYSPEQLRSKEHELQERITKAQREFRERGTVVQQAAQYGLAQIERTLVGVIQKVAESRGMNLVLHRQQVALNVNEFDISEQVAELLNKVLPSVVIPPDGVSPAAMVQSQTKAEPAAETTQPAAAPKKK